MFYRSIIIIIIIIYNDALNLNLKLNFNISNIHASSVLFPLIDNY
jgi:hypothetical protein